jgi:predicted anti-sigma-YlaC factor YlaD
MARQNEHNRVEELISAYLDKRVSAEEKDFFERHIASCAACRAQLETTRSMVAALQAMPAVKAPRSFVLPREMAKQPQRSFLSLYPALRLATVVAAMAFAVLFAGDLLINQMGVTSAPQSIPAAAPAPVAIQAPAAPRQAVAPTQEPAAETSSAAATAPVEPPAPAAAAGAAAKASATAVVTETTMAMPAPTATSEATVATADSSDASTMALSATPVSAEPLLDQQVETATEQPAMAYATEAAPAPTIDPLRIIEIALLVLAVVLGIATIVVRRKQA